MRQLKLFGTIMLGLLAITAIMATTASAKPEFLPATANKILDTGTETSKGVAGALETLTGLITIKCKENLVLGEITSNEEGNIDVHFKGCEALGFPANSLGDAKEVILMGKTPFKLCYINESTKHVGIYIEKVNVHVEVALASALINVLGSIIGLIEPVNSSKKGPFKVNFTQKSAGDPTFTTCTLLGKELKASLTASKDAKHEKNESSSIVQTDEIFFANAVEVMA